MKGALMVCGTTSDAGKTTLVAGLCRVLRRRGIDVAPFKAQNMALNSAVTIDGHEIGRAQYLQAEAAGVVPDVTMNPILLKPTGQRASQVIVMGEAVGEMTATEYHAAKPEFLGLVLNALAELRSRHEIVLLEGAGSPAEINLLDRDIVNLRIAQEADLPAIVVGDIDRGGVFASLYGTVALLPDELRAHVVGFVINKLRGDPTMLFDGTAQLEARCGVPTLGVVPMLDGLRLDAEDSLALDIPRTLTGEEGTADGASTLDVAVIRLPHISNFTDVDPLLLEPSVSVRYVTSAMGLGRPDLVLLPGSKTTVADLQWLRRCGLADAIVALARAGSTVVLGVCAGYQMLGERIDDEVESGNGTSAGLGLLPVVTRFDEAKMLARRIGTAFGQPVDGYQIHHGRVTVANGPGTSDGETGWLHLDEESGCRGEDGVAVGNVYGTTLHGLFESDPFRRAFLQEVARVAGRSFEPSAASMAAHRSSELDRLADHLIETLDVDRIIEIATTAGAPPNRTARR